MEVKCVCVFCVCVHANKLKGGAAVAKCESSKDFLQKLVTSQSTADILFMSTDQLTEAGVAVGVAYDILGGSTRALVHKAMCAAL